MKLKQSLEEKTQELQQRLAEMGDEILELLYEEAKGTIFAVAKNADRRQFVKNAEQVAESVATVGKVCKTCKQPVLTTPLEVWEVWKTRPNVAALKHLHEQIMGRAQQKKQEEVDPEIFVVFGDIDSVDNLAVATNEGNEQRLGNEVNKLKGSPTRTDGKDILLGITEL